MSTILKASELERRGATVTPPATESTGSGWRPWGSIGMLLALLGASIGVVFVLRARDRADSSVSGPPVNVPPARAVPQPVVMPQSAERPSAFPPAGPSEPPWARVEKKRAA